jgi:CubicO group peptidase (beta-lactamase class C family)
MTGQIITLLLLAWVASANNNINAGNLQLALNSTSTLAQQTVDANAVPGLAIAVVYNNTVIYSTGLGVKLEGTNTTVTAETVFQIASLSKPVSSTIVAAVVSKGGIAWDSPVNSPTTIAEYSDSWISDKLMLSDAFSHRSGLYGLTGDDLEGINYNRSTILSRVKYMAPIGPFRVTYAYSNYGLTLGAEAAAASTGKAWEDVAQEFLYRPLNMGSTSSRYSDFIQETNRAALHVPDGNGGWTPSPARNPDPQSPAGGVTSNVIDLAKWLQLHLRSGKLPSSDTQLISETALNETRYPQVVRGPHPLTGMTGFYGLGWNIDYEDGRTWHAHAGAFSQGTRSLVKMNVADGIGIVILSNCFPTGRPEGIADNFFDIVYYGKARRDYVTIWDDLYAQLASLLEGGQSPFTGSPPANATSALPLASYTGRYTNDYVGVAEIGGSSTDSLVLTFPGQSNASLALSHWDRDTFFIESQKAFSSSGVSFSIGPDGVAASITIAQLDGNQGGTLVRNQESTPIEPSDQE